ncbi:leucine-rich repeat protein 1 isoform X2 [Latimeria chalumnae]|uniref:leucine-rich repeat protein 1 isoform X2 n=1 Tax=Latimeria chalumnae TaxID=7897 RepID=UPI0003C1A72A|nr:PREDICTED: leucine-rich repeat protein 1 isoform X3 [Latimeria chalumnae]XP_014343294.1 PREDICTED: leucine-rich repeat protein 1 isoform X3 [Latimeria chalumnae]|eukprot:XP_005995034.1 PREDICTED: leucine-rich repeat protein 1 isoform X3 [Latimeria chalumnae]
MFLSFLFRLMMKLQCEVEVINRMLPTFGMRNRGKGTRAVLSIGRHQDKATKTTSVYLLVCTLKDKAGSKYKLKENIEQFFTKFLEEGKATVRLKEPAVDVCLSKADASNLKNFLSALRLAHRGNDIENLPLSTLAPAKTSEIEKPKTKLVVTSKKDYPLTTNFPYSLEHLQVSYCKLARVDMRMLCLKKLRKLDLSHNHIKKLPATIGDLVFLQELILHNNHLESFNVRLCSSTLQKSLQFLDLSQNKLQALPLQFCQLRELVHLKLDDNELIRLPFKIGQFCKLRFLSAAHNKLPYLPRDFKRLCLENLDLFGNPFEQPNPLAPSIQLKIPLTLLEITARSVVNYSYRVKLTRIM